MIFSKLLLASVASAGVVHMPLNVRDAGSHPEHFATLAKRDVLNADTVMITSYYEATLLLGTPPQEVQVNFDTGSGILAVPATNTTTCTKDLCHADGQFDVGNSSSWRYRSEGKQWAGQGMWGRETVGYAGSSLKSFAVFVPRDKMTNNFGIFGQSPIKNGSQSFVQGLADSKHISRALYSITAESPIISYNNNRDKKTQAKSHVVYGGFDRAKYEGPLVTIDRPSYGGYEMPMSGFSVDGEPVDDQQQHTVVLDTGGITLTLPNRTMEAMSLKHGGHYSAANNMWMVSCDAKPVLQFGFGYTAIDVDMDQYIAEVPGEGCGFKHLNIAKDSDRLLLQGPMLISKALVIYDNDRQQIHIARAKYTDASDVVEITGDVPGAVKYTDWLAGKPLSEEESSKEESSSKEEPSHTTLAVAV
ncbi:Acid protease [Yarrowia sp. B02]|nr:Acid protease [Yarrowia sp. B02]